MIVESDEVPWTIVDGRKCLTGQQIVENPHLCAFVERFRDCFKLDLNRDVVWFEPPTKK